MNHRFAIDNGRLILTECCSVALLVVFSRASTYATAEFGAPNVILSGIARPWHKTEPTLLMFVLFAPAFVSGFSVVLHGAAWQRVVAAVLLLFPIFFLLRFLLWVLEMML